MSFNRVSRRLVAFYIVWMVVLAGAFGPYGCAQEIDTQVKADAVPRETVLGTVFMVRPAWDVAIDELVEKVRKQLRDERAKGKLICYISIPLSATGGGHRPTNVDISKFIKRGLESHYGHSQFWALAPGVIETELPKIDGQSPAGGEYLYMWTKILAGEDGKGDDFEMVYFVGPHDIHSYFGIIRGGVLENLNQYVTDRAEVDEVFRTEVAMDSQRRMSFIRYYGIRAAASYSKGAHDEWNIFRLINRRRELSEQIAMYFDGRAVSMGAGEQPVRPGYEERR